MKKSASILDYSYPFLDSAVWDLDLKLYSYQRDFILRLIDKMYETYGLKEHEKWVTEVVILGSLTTTKWLLSSDLDVHIRVNLDAFITTNMPGVSKEEAFAKLDEVRKEFDRAKILLPMTQHPAEFYFESADIKSSNEEMVGVYSLMQDKWLKEPILFDASLDLEESKKSVVEAAEALAEELDSSLGTIKRDIQRVDELETVIKAWDKEKQQLFYNKIETKLNNIEEEIIKDLKIKQDLVDERHLKQDATSDNELTFKYLQRYGFFGILSQLKKLLEQTGGEVTTTELPLIEKIISEGSLGPSGQWWFDPNGKFYSVELPTHNHTEWIQQNVGIGNIDDAIKKGWIRACKYGDKASIHLESLQNIPDFITDFILKLNDKSIFIEDLNRNYINVLRKDVIEQGVQKAVNKALSHKRLQTASLDFDSWFNGSKVVDSNGKPLLCHHETNVNFKKVNPKKTTQGIFWFTTDRGSIDRGETGAAGHGMVKDFYVSMKNPAGWKEYENLLLVQLKSQGYDGALLSQGDGTYNGFVFDNSQIWWVTPKKASLHVVARAENIVWVAPNSKVFPVEGSHMGWIQSHSDILKQYGIESGVNDASGVERNEDLWDQMLRNGWVRISDDFNEFIVDCYDMMDIPNIIEDIILKEQPTMVRVEDLGRDVVLSEEDLSLGLRKAINKALQQKRLQPVSSLKQAFLKEAFEEPKEAETDICIDLDKTIAQDATFPAIGDPIEGAKESLAKLQEMGYNVVIYSCRADSEEGLELVREWLDKHEIPYDSIFEGEKPFSKYFIDDKAIHFDSWKNVLKQVEKSDKTASLRIVAYDRAQAAYWVDPNGKVYPVKTTHEDWFFEQEDLLRTQYQYGQDELGQDWWDIKTGNLLNQLLEDGWLRVGDLFAAGRKSIGTGIEIGNLSNIPSTLIDFVANWGKDKYFQIEDLQRRVVELSVEELVADGQEAINRALQQEKMLSRRSSFDLPVIDPKTLGRKEPYALFIGTQWNAKHTVGLDLYNIYPMTNADNGVPTVGLQTLVDKNIPVIGKEPRAGDKQPSQDISGLYKRAILDKKADVVEISTTYSRGEFPVLIDPTEDEESKLIQKSQYNELRYLDGYNGVTYVWDAYRSTHAEVAQELHYRGFDVDTNSPRGTISQNNVVALEMEASLKKEAAYAHAYWIDPKGKIFQVRGEGVTSEDMNRGDLNTHSDWVRANIDMLVNEYGFKPKPAKSTGLFDMPLNSNNLIAEGWIRIGDSSGGSEWGVTLKDLNYIPQSVDNLLAQFVPEGAKITIEEDTSWQNHVQIEWPVNSVQLAVNQARRQQPVMASKAFSKKEITAEQKSPMIEYACIMANIPKEISQEIVEWGVRNVKDEDIYMKDGLLGRELDSHITIKYGIISDNPKEVEKLFEGMKQFKATLGEVKHFSPEGREFDVLTVSVESKDLSDMNEKITKELKCATGLPSDEYHPHITISYIKKGTCKDLYGNKEFVGKEITINSAVFSPVEGDKSTIELGNKKEAAYRGNMDCWLAPDGKEYSATRSHTAWIVDEANLLKQEYGLTLPAEGSPEDDNLIAWLLSKGWVRVSGVLPTELDLLIQDLNNIPQSAEQFVWKYKPEMVIVEDLNDNDISFDREEYSKGMMKKAEFLPSLFNAPDNHWTPESDKEIALNPDSVSDDTTEYEPCTDGKYRSPEVWRQFISMFSKPLSKKDEMTVDSAYDPEMEEAESKEMGEEPLIEYQKGFYDPKKHDFPHNTTWDSLTQDGEPSKPTSVTYSPESNEDNLDQNSPGGAPRRFMGKPKGEWSSTSGEAIEALENMFKNREAAINSLTRDITASWEGYWISPEGKLFEVPSMMEHDEWIFNKYHLTSHEAFGKGWIRIRMLGSMYIQLDDMHSVPSSVDDFIAGHTAGVIIVDDKYGTGSANVSYEDAIKYGINKAIIRSLKQPVMAKQASIEDVEGIKVFVNPSWNELANSSRKLRGGHMFRGLIDPHTGDLFVWDAYTYIHQDMIAALGLDIEYSEESPYCLYFTPSPLSINDALERQQEVKQGKIPRSSSLKKQAGSYSSTYTDEQGEQFFNEQHHDNVDEEPYVDHSERDYDGGYWDAATNTGQNTPWAKDITPSVCLLDQLQNPADRNYPPGMPDYSIVFYESLPMSDSLEATNPD
jgi:2'-5' RNA ligase